MHLFKESKKTIISENYNIKSLQQISSPFTSFVTVPITITVHLGNPDEEAENVTVSYLDYIKNVGSSELYPTWPEEALRANLHAITSVAMNRVYTEWYRSRGYNFDITNSTRYDQAFVYNRGIFDSISVLADEIFTQYIVRDDEELPLFAQFCDGRLTQCEGMAQWGSVELADEGYAAIEILKYYYGEDIRTVTDAVVGEVEETYPGEPLMLGDSSLSVLRMQLGLDRIRLNYPGIPQIEIIEGYFNEDTEQAVRVFQEVFNLPVTGVVDQATWYSIRYIFIAVTRLAELAAEGALLSRLYNITQETYLEGDIRPGIELIQYALNVLSIYYPSIQGIAITGIFDEQTREQVIEFQKIMNLEPTGVVNRETFDALTASVFGILDTLPPESVYLPIIRWPGVDYSLGDESPSIYVIQEMLSYISLIIPTIPYIEPSVTFDENTQQAVITFQNMMGLKPTGIIDQQTWNSIVEVYRQQRFGGLNEVPQSNNTKS